MASKTASGSPIREHSIVAKLVAEGGPDLRAYRGYVGASAREGYFTLYPNLMELGESFEIRRSDVIHVEEIPAEFAPWGAIMLWVAVDADVSARVEVTTKVVAAAGGTERIESQHGRLQMVRHADAEVRGDSCTSNCTCQSTCNGPCISSCRWTCGKRPV